MEEYIYDRYMAHNGFDGASSVKWHTIKEGSGSENSIIDYVALYPDEMYRDYMYFDGLYKFIFSSYIKGGSYGQGSNSDELYGTTYRVSVSNIPIPDSSTSLFMALLIITYYKKKSLWTKHIKRWVTGILIRTKKLGAVLS